jgi:hypothetical protein
MAIQRYFGRSGLARFLGVTETRVGQLNPSPDALVDGRPVWALETAARLKVTRESRLAERQALRDKRNRAAMREAVA